MAFFLLHYLGDRFRLYAVLMAVLTIANRVAFQIYCKVDEAETDIIDVMYSDPRILEKIVNIISEGRANTVDKAVDALYVESGKTKEQSRRYLDLVASRQADYGGKDAAVFCSADFFGAYHMKK